MLRAVLLVIARKRFTEAGADPVLVAWMQIALVPLLLISFVQAWHDLLHLFGDWHVIPRAMLILGGIIFNLTAL